MREIKASTRVTGKRRDASLEAAKRKVIDGGIYLIRRHGAFFRPGALGYVTEIAGAGVFDGKTARRYLDVEGLSVVPLRSMMARLQQEAVQAEASLVLLRGLIDVAARAVS